MNIDSVIAEDVSVNLIRENPAFPHTSSNVLYSMCRLERLSRSLGREGWYKLVCDAGLFGVKTVTVVARIMIC